MPVLIFGVLIALCGSVAAQTAAPVAVARVYVAEVKKGQRVVGNVHPLRRSTVGSAVDGRVEKFLVQRGDAIRQGQALAQLRTQTLEIELAAAQAQLRLFQHQVAELENGTLPETLAEAKANLMGAKAARDNAARQLDRLKSLSVSRAASDADLEDAQERADATFFRMRAVEALLERLEDGPRPELIAQAKARVELQQQNIRLLEDRIAKFTIRAPYDGFVAQEFSQVGTWISQGDPIVEVVELDQVEVEVPTPAQHAVHLRRGDSMRVEFPELPDQLFVGQVDRIVPVAQSRARTFPVFVRLENTLLDGVPMLMAGMMARVDLPAGKRSMMPLVPKDALVLNGADRAVFAIDLDPADERRGTARRVPVELGVAVGGRIQVRGSVRENELVVIDGNERLVHGNSVQIVRVDERPDIVPTQPDLNAQTANEAF